MTKIITNKPIAVDSLDHKHPYGVINDNNSAFQYIMEVKNYFKNNKISVLDLGCAGGQIIVDHHNLDDFAVGLFNKDKWKQIFKDNGFEMTEYIFKTLPRQDLLPHLIPNYRNGFVFTARKI